MKNKAFPIIESYGLTPAQVIKLLFRQIAETRVLPLSFDYLAEKDSEEDENTEL
ncbi:MAG: type II toxin-antitoxin system RelB/DinJ family antitoxin [Cardiobacteriaceae bacterium]|nr:type II toxin-antitoxin system RelB/DinJ family antitoxin [Cardiobacteriaceae bacterium]